MSDSSSPVKKPRPAGRWKRLLQNLCLSAFIFLLCLAVSEMVLRMAGYGNLELYDADAKVYWRLKPNQDCYTKVDHKPVHINSRGVRGPEFEVPKPARTFRILSFGDSRTFGWGLSDEETYSRRVEKLLNAFHHQLGGATPSSESALYRAFAGATNIEVINTGVNAWSYPQMVIYLREYGFACQPDMVMLGGGNLWTQFSEKNSPEFVRQMMRRVRLKTFVRRFALYDFVVENELRQVYERTRAKFVPIDPDRDTLFKEEQQKDPDAFFRDAIAAFCQTAVSNHVQPLLVFLPAVEELGSTNTGRILAANQTVSRQLNVPWCDPRPGLLAEKNKKTLYLDADPVHFSAYGNQIVAESIFEAITNVIMR